METQNQTKKKMCFENGNETNDLRIHTNNTTNNIIHYLRETK